MDRIHIKKKLFFWYAILWIFLFIAMYQAYFVYFVDTTSTKSKWVALFAGAVALLLSACKVCEISYYSSKNPAIEKISRYFTNGSLLFIKRIFKTLLIVFLISSILLKGMGIKFILCYLTGGLFSYLTVFCSSIITSKTATRSSQFYAESNTTALKQLHCSGVIISNCMVVFAIIPLVILFHLFKDYQIINGFVLGAAVVAIISNVTTVISKQAVDNAADVVENSVGEINKNDRRNPLLLLNGVSKTILGVNVLSTDLFVAFSAAIVAAMTVGGEFLQLMGAFLPLIIAGSGIFANVLVILLTNIEKSQNPVKTLFLSMFGSNLVLLIISSYLIKTWLPQLMTLLFPIAIGAFGGYIICFVHSNLIFSKYKPVLNVSNAAISGLSPTLRQVVKEGFSGVFAPGLIFALCIILSFVLSGGIDEPSLGLYGILLAILSSVCSVGLMLCINAFGLTTSSVDTVLETYEEDLYDNNYPQQNILSTAGEFIFSLGKNYLNAIAILTSIGLIIGYTILALLEEVDILNPYVLGSIFVGATIPFLYSTCVMGIVSKTARRLVLEVKRQLKNAPQIVRYEMRPNYENCVEISAINASIQVVINTLLIIALMGYIVYKLKTEALCGFVFGAIVSTFGLVFLTSGNSLVIKNARKYFENRTSETKNPAERAAITSSEEFFNSLKEIIVPTLNILIKFMAILIMALIPLYLN